MELQRCGYIDKLEEANEILNYKKLSISLGLHKDSFNFLSKVQSATRMQNLKKLKELYQINDQRLEQDTRLPLRHLMYRNNCQSSQGFGNNSYIQPMMPEIKEKVNNYGSIKPMRRGASQYNKTKKEMNFT